MDNMYKKYTNNMQDIYKMHAYTIEHKTARTFVADRHESRLANPTKCSRW